MLSSSAAVYDVVVIGGGAAGVSATVALARSCRSVLMIDAGEPRNMAAGHVHNYLGREGSAPGDLLASGREAAVGYGAEVRVGEVVAASMVQGNDRMFRVELSGGPRVLARRLLFCTGMTDELPVINGIADLWGRDVLHCPYCHGWEVRGQKLAVIGSGPQAAQQALQFRQWSSDVTIVMHTAPPIAPEMGESLEARGIRIVHGRVESFETIDGRLSGLRLGSGKIVSCVAAIVSPRFRARADLMIALGIETVDTVVDTYVTSTHVPTDSAGQSGVKGVYLAGNVADPRAQVVGAASAGLMVAAAINSDLIAEETLSAVAQYRRRAIS